MGLNNRLSTLQTIASEKFPPIFFIKKKKPSKRKNRSVSPEVAQKISQALKRFNQTHPRGTAKSGSRWSKSIQKSVKNYWDSIPPVTTNDGKQTTMDDLI